ncbi:MAG: acetyl-CoA hydrolase/transferase C-terminal domain-containing protein [Gammaproteobacteria bacterium]
MTETGVKIVNPTTCVDWLLESIGPRLVVGTPLGLGKANHLLNELFRRASADRSIELTIFTALTLEIPHARSDIEARFLDPLVERLFAGYPDLAYAKARRDGTLPDNIEVHEFFMSPGKWLSNRGAQQDYISSNYTHVARDMLGRGVNVLVQMVSPGDGAHAGHYSLSCNPDVTLDLVPMMRAQGSPCAIVGEVNDQLPFMHGDAVQPARYFDALCEVPNGGYTLFAPPKTPVSLTDHAIGLHVSTLVRDAGTLQVGIGSMADAVVNALILRHRDNRRYRTLMGSRTDAALVGEIGGLDVFDRGLYGATEMLVDGFMDLFDHGILKRRVYDDVALQTLLNAGEITDVPDLAALDALVRAGAVHTRLTQTDFKYLTRWGMLRDDVQWRDGQLVFGDGSQCAGDLASSAAREQIAARGLGAHLQDGAVAHGGFFLGPTAFYQRLRDLSEADRSLLRMTSVGRINQLYGGETLDRVQRHDARFINSCLMVTLFGAVVSDGLDDGRVISGVGGQYNFVAMAHALPGGRSIIKTRATRESKGVVTSNIVFNYGHATIPRHLRDLVVTEYGVANLRGKTDAECARALIEIADARFQSDLRQRAVDAGKLPATYQIAERYRRNTPEALKDWLGAATNTDVFGRFPLGTDLTRDEQVLGSALKQLQAETRNWRSTLVAVARSCRTLPQADALMRRMGLAQPVGARQRLTARLLRSALQKKNSE